MSNLKSLSLGALACVFVMVTAISAQAYTIDLFNSPPEVTVINFYNLNPALLKAPAPTFGDILGEERDLLLKVSEPAESTSYTGSIGAGTFVFNSGTPGTIATLQYDGIDADVTSHPASLVNNEGLGGFDFTQGGADRFKLNFNSIDGGNYSDTDIQIEVHNGTSNVARFVGTIVDNPNPFSYQVLFSSPDWSGDLTVLSSATSLEITFNPSGHPDVDFTITPSYGTPEPATMGLLALGSLAMLIRRRRK